MTRRYSEELRERALARFDAGETTRAAAAALRISPSCGWTWMKRKRETGSLAPGQVGGRKKLKLRGAPAGWLRERCRFGPFTTRGLVAELAARGIKSDRRASWMCLHAEGLSYDNNLAGGRADPTRHRPSPGALEGSSGPDRPGAARLHRRDPDQDQHGPATGLGPEGAAPPGPRAPWPREDADLRGRAKRRPHRSTPGRRRPDQRRAPHPRCREGVGFNPQGRRRRDPRQSRQPQGSGRPPRHPGRRRPSPLPAALQPRAAPIRRNAPDPMPQGPPPIGGGGEQLFAKLKHLLRKAGPRSVAAAWRKVGDLLDAFSPAGCANCLKNARLCFRRKGACPSCRC